MRRPTWRAPAAGAAAVLACLAAPGAGAEDWIGLDQAPPLMLGADAGQDSNGDPMLSLLIDAPLAERAGFAGYYSTTEISDGEQRFDSHAFVSSIWLQVNALLDIELTHFFDGNSGELEREALGLTLGLDFGEWRLGIEFSDGETQIFTRDIGFERIDSRVPDFIDSDVDGLGVTFASQGLGTYWRLAYQTFDYQRDLSPLTDSPLLQQVVSSAALAQSGLLVAEQASLQLGHADLDDDFSLVVASDRSAIDDERAEALGLSWLRWGEGNLGYRLSASMPLPIEDDIGWSLGLRWIL